MDVPISTDLTLDELQAIRFGDTSALVSPNGYDNGWTSDPDRTVVTNAHDESRGD
jgi:hypothetical protein